MSEAFSYLIDIRIKALDVKNLEEKNLALNTLMYQELRKGLPGGEPLLPVEDSTETVKVPGPPVFEGPSQQPVDKDSG